MLDLALGGVSARCERSQLQPHSYYAVPPVARPELLVDRGSALLKSCIQRPPSLARLHFYKRLDPVLRGLSNTRIQ